MNILCIWILALAARAEEPKIAPAPIADPVADDAAFRDPKHYPKQRLLASVQPRSVAGTHSAINNDFSFRGYGVGYGLAYEFHTSARLAMGVDYQHLDLRVENSQSNSMSVQASNASFDAIGLNAHYCFFGNSNFFQQICPGAELMQDAYPALLPTDAGAFEIGRVYDVVFGPTLTYQSPVSEQIVFRAIAGYAFGTGLGNSAGALAPRSDTRYYLRLGGRWEPITHHALGADIEWINRSITVRDKNSADLETTKSTDLGLRLTYAFTF